MLQIQEQDPLILDTNPTITATAFKPAPVYKKFLNKLNFFSAPVLPTFSDKLDSAFDLSTYANRAKHFIMLCNPVSFFYSDKKLVQFQKNISDFEAGRLTSHQISNAELWKQKYALLCSIHPQTKKPIFRLGRINGFTPLNIPITFALSVIPPTPVSQAISQTVNQTYNFIMNVSNRNTSVSVNYKQMGLSYFLAVSSSIVSSLGMLKIANRIVAKGTRPGLGKALTVLAPTIGVYVAHQCNLFFSRMQDLTQGVQLQDQNTGELVKGVYSKIAGKQMYTQMAISRVILPSICILLPSVAVAALKTTSIYPKGKVMGNLAGLGIVCLCLQLSLVLAVGAFPQFMQFNANQLEPIFQNQYDKDGQKIQKYIVNKGL